MKKLLVIDRKTLKTRRVYDFKWLFVASIAINILSFSFKEKEIKYMPVIVNHRADTTNDIILDDTSIVKELSRIGCVLPNVALAQFKIESAHYKSRIAIENKNIAGIKTSRSKYVAGKKNGHSAYKSYRDCLKDYVRIQNMYLKNIDGKYAEDGSYVQLVNRMK